MHSANTDRPEMQQAGAGFGRDVEGPEDARSCLDESLSRRRPASRQGNDLGEYYHVERDRGGGIMRFECIFVSCKTGEIRTVSAELEADELVIVADARARGGDAADALALRRAYQISPAGFVPMRNDVRWLT